MEKLTAVQVEVINAAVARECNNVNPMKYVGAVRATVLKGLTAKGLIDANGVLTDAGFAAVGATRTSNSKLVERNKRAVTQLNTIKALKKGWMSQAAIVELTGWNPKSVPVIFSAVFKGEMGLPLKSKKNADGVRVYHIG